MRQQVDLVENQEVGGSEHVRILERFVVALGHRKNHHLGALAEIEKSGADKMYCANRRNRTAAGTLARFGGGFRDFAQGGVIEIK